MKPITEDQVLSLMKGLETREENALKRLASSVERPDTKGRMTARILSYTRPYPENRTPCENDANPIPLNEVRAAQSARRTSQSHFFYSQSAGQTPG